MHKDASTPIVLAEMNKIWVEMWKRQDEAKHITHITQPGSSFATCFCNRDDTTTRRYVYFAHFHVVLRHTFGAAK